MSKFLETYTRTHGCGDLRAADAGKRVVLTGWVQTYRDLGGSVFVDLRDRGGLTQIRFDASFDADAHKMGRELRSEWCIGIVGDVRSRGDNVNDRMVTDASEVFAEEIEVFS